MEINDYGCELIKDILDHQKEFKEPYYFERFQDVFYLIQGRKFDFSEITFENMNEYIEKNSYIRNGLIYFGSNLLKTFDSELEKHIYEIVRNCIEMFFEKHIDKVNWWNLSENSSLSEAFCERYLNHMSRYILRNNFSIYISKRVSKYMKHVLNN